MQQYYYNPKVTLLLVNHYDKKSSVLYEASHHTLLLPTIGPRPPYYTNPIYKQYYPII